VPDETLQIRSHGDSSLPALIYLPGIHGDWTLIGSLRARLAGRVRFVEFTYPRTLAWSLDDYAAAITGLLLENGLTRGTVLAESFGSQVAWPLLSRAADGGGFTAERLILAGGFARYPFMPGVALTRRFLHRASMHTLCSMLVGYRRYATFRHRHALETLADMDAFIARRTPPDRDAAVHRLDLIRGNDPRTSARAVRVPLFALTGGVDPIVPWPLALPWLRRNCPALRDTKILWRADHNVLSTEPDGAARWILRWMGMTDTP
jgi:pimeloyl-ACP methyl ester carboxylesterase